MREIFRVVLLVFGIFGAVETCTLCHFRTPPRPRPLDQYQLPKFGKSLDLEKFPKFCNASKSLPVDQECRKQFEKIFCSTDLLTDSFSGCPSLVGRSAMSEQQQCSICSHQKAANMWVLKWFDSIGKPAAGITDGNYYWLGDYEMCSDMRSEKSFDGQYCRVEMEVEDAGVESGCPQTDPLSIVIGVCFPSACSAEQLKLVSQLYVPYKLKVECESDSSWSSIAYVLVALFVCWVSLQFWAETQHGETDSILDCFAVSENAKRTLSTRREREELHCVHGLEFLLNFVIISGMVYNFMLPYIENVAFSFEGVSSIGMHIVNNYSFHIDGLMALSSFYTTYLLYANIADIKDALKVILMRLYRFWPAYITCVIFMYTIFPGITSGPMWIHSDTVDRCASGWWKNILFINNWYNVSDTCVDFGYVISMEAQFFVLLVFVVYFANSFLLTTQLLAYAGIISSIAYTFYRAYSQSLPPAPMLTLEPVPISQTYALFTTLLFNPFSRISSYCMGFIFGIGCRSANELRTSGLSYNPHKVLAVMCILCAIYPFTGAFSYAAHAVDDPFWSAIYAAFHRPLWSFALLSFVYLCHHDAFEWLNVILGWRVFAPLSKLTWMTLVVAEPVILYFFSSLNKPAYATHWSTMYTAISATVLSYLFAMLLDIFVTRPIRYLIYPEQRKRYAETHALASTD